MSRVRALQLALWLALSALAFGIGWSLDNGRHFELPALALALISLGVGGIVLALIPFIIIQPARWAREQIRTADVSDLIAASIGLVVGLIVAALLAIPLSQLKFWNLGTWLPSLAALLFAYLGIATAVLRKEDFAKLFTMAFAGRNARRAAREERDEEQEDRDEIQGGKIRERFGGRGKSKPGERILVDTSAIIDGRIADISQTGFIPGALVVPRFVLEELQHIADSADGMRRARGRRGLDVLQRLKESPVTVEITDADVENVPEVDAKLVKLARQWKCAIITNDFNLNRVADLQGVKVLNINELAHAVKPILIPGEEMEVKIMQDGKELGQGVGYLDDGTMIVVENGKSHMGDTIDVTVTRVLQTVAGRMIFAQPKQASTAAPPRRTGTA
ncbi:MAG TPA: PIN domain-containing protein [Ktedonobacterales bacterium]|nr:PIN domain-containing protein [Ktedonobacterales bacterium]